MLALQVYPAAQVLPLAPILATSSGLSTSVQFSVAVYGSGGAGVGCSASVTSSSLEVTGPVSIVGPLARRAGAVPQTLDGTLELDPAVGDVGSATLTITAACSHATSSSTAVLVHVVSHPAFSKC